MIHGMLCTLLVGSVLPEPEPAKFWVEVELVAWEVPGQPVAVTTVSPPAHARSLGLRRLAVDDPRFDPSAGIAMGDCCVWVKASKQSAGGRRAFRVAAVYEDDDWRGSLGEVASFELTPGAEAMHPPHRHGNRILAFIVRLRRVK